MATCDDIPGGSTAGSASAREARLHRQDQFDAVRKDGHTEAGRFCVVAVLAPSPDNGRKAAFAISRRFSKLAVERNRARRLFRETYRNLYPALPPSWVVFIPRQRIKDVRQQEVEAEVRKCLAHLLPGVVL